MRHIVIDHKDIYIRVYTDMGMVYNMTYAVYNTLSLLNYPPIATPIY